MHKAVVIIPSRFDSIRFPGKPLATLNGKSIIHHVYEQASGSALADSVYVATDDERILKEVNSFGGRTVMTSRSHICGTDRIAEAAKNIECDIIVNVQGDEPFIRAEMVDDIIHILRDDEKASMSTLCVRIDNQEDLLSPHTVKVVMNKEGYALYFSRAPIPYCRDHWRDLNSISFIPDKTVVMKHIGIYGFRKNVLMEFTSMEKSELEHIEKLEQLRALSAGLKIKVRETKFNTFGIDTKEDLRKAEEWQNIFL
ncbi:MAG: 3-deoxy-manno-octulosonate cytidylyltransferase [Nitrospiraceae bacterium]|nr:MAG: 3-deoxy-manno-octulosonate cytidylyltransferase [Nitrospiraceae bacterium]